MANNIADIAQERSAQDFKNATQEFKEKAKVAGLAAWDMTKASYQQLQSKTRQCTDATDKAIRNRPYVSLGIAMGVGVLLGALISRRSKAAEKE